MLSVGDKLKANWTERITDHVTVNKVYTVSYTHKSGIFHIINDNEEDVMPISVSFTKVN